MLQAFYQTETPDRDTPYRTLRLMHDVEKGWLVVQRSGTEWGPGKGKVESETLVKDWDEGKVVYDRLFRELMEAGWMPYTPQLDSRIGNTTGFQREVRTDLKKPGKSQF